eukprot:scaffold17452_cov27-Tisochrysis_lutea.AAC.2
MSVFSIVCCLRGEVVVVECRIVERALVDLLVRGVHEQTLVRGDSGWVQVDGPSHSWGEPLCAAASHHTSCRVHTLAITLNVSLEPVKHMLAHTRREIPVPELDGLQPPCTPLVAREGRRLFSQHHVQEAGNRPCGRAARARDVHGKPARVGAIVAEAATKLDERIRDARGRG